MILRSQIAGFWLAAFGLLLALALPLSSETVAPLMGRPGLLAAVIAAACLFALAPRWPVLSAACGGLGVVLGCFVTLILLDDSGIAGDAAWGFWLLTLATWLGAILTLARLAALRTADQSTHWLQDLAIPLLFGAFLIYLWVINSTFVACSPSNSNISRQLPETEAAHWPRRSPLSWCNRYPGMSSADGSFALSSRINMRRSLAANCALTPLVSPVANNRSRPLCRNRWIIAERNPSTDGCQCKLYPSFVASDDLPSGAAQRLP